MSYDEELIFKTALDTYCYEFYSDICDINGGGKYNKAQFESMLYQLKELYSAETFGDVVYY